MIETSAGTAWDRTAICDPAEGRQSLGDKHKRVEFADAEGRRRAYLRDVSADFLGDDTRDGLVSEAELAAAHRDLDNLSFGELVAASAEANSGSAPTRGEAGADRPAIAG